MEFTLHQIVAFIVEYHNSPTFMGQKRQPTGSFTITFLKADKSIRLVYVAYPLSVDAKLNICRKFLSCD